MQFTEKIKKTPEIVEKLDSLLSSSKVTSMIHSNKSIEKLIDVFDPNCYHEVESSNIKKTEINEWSNITDYKTNITFTNINNKVPNVDHNAVAPDPTFQTINPFLFHQYFPENITTETTIIVNDDNNSYNRYVDNNIPDFDLNNNDKFFRKSSILNCGAGACDEIRPMIDLIMNRVPDNSVNRGGLHNRNWSTTPGKLDIMKIFIEHSNVNKFEINDINIGNQKNAEGIYHSMGSGYYEKYKFKEVDNKRPYLKMKELKEYHKHNTTLTNILSLFFSMLGIDEKTNTVLSPKTIMEYLLNFMCWGSYTLTNVPSTVDINIGNGIPLTNENVYDNINILDINFYKDERRYVGISIFSYFVSMDLTNDGMETQYDLLFDYQNQRIRGTNERTLTGINVGGAANPMAFLDTGIVNLEDTVHAPHNTIAGGLGAYAPIGSVGGLVYDNTTPSNAAVFPALFPLPAALAAGAVYPNPPSPVANEYPFLGAGEWSRFFPNLNGGVQANAVLAAAAINIYPGRININKTSRSVLLANIRNNIRHPSNVNIAADAHTSFRVNMLPLVEVNGTVPPPGAALQWQQILIFILVNI